MPTLAGKVNTIIFFIKARTCDAEEIRCPEGACLPASAKCNGWPECSNGADEVGCTGMSNISVFHFRTDMLYFLRLLCKILYQNLTVECLGHMIYLLPKLKKYIRP